MAKLHVFGARYRGVLLSTYHVERDTEVLLAGAVPGFKRSYDPENYEIVLLRDIDEDGHIVAEYEPPQVVWSGRGGIPQ